MSTTHGSWVTEVKILVQPRDNTTVKLPFKYPVIVGVKVGGLTAEDIRSARPSIDILLWATPTKNQTINPRVFPDPPTLELVLPARGDVIDSDEFTFYYRIDSLPVNQTGNHFMTVTSHVPLPNPSPEKPGNVSAIHKSQTTRTFMVHPANGSQNIPKPDLSEKEKYWLQRAGVDIK